MPTRGMNKVVFEDVREEEGKSGSWNENVSCSNESSSSIGKNSDLSENLSEKLGDDEEVESKYKGPLDAMDALEQVLPIRRGISRFYNGKSKSFASLADSSSLSSIKEIAKPNNVYTRKRTNLLARNLRGGGNGSGISKRVTSSGRSALALAVAMSNSESDHNKQTGECNSGGGGGSISVSSLPSSRKDFCSLRSFSLADLQQHCVAVSCSDLHELGAKQS